MLVSAVMPTRGRPEFSRQCLDCWRIQAWEHKELLVIDDYDDPSFPLGLRESGGVRYELMPGRPSIGEKRNLGAKLAHGEVVVHFDSDDLYSPDRMFDQVMRLEGSGKSVTGYTGMRFTDGHRWWKNNNKPGGFGASLCYRRDWWAQHPFPNTSDGEDWGFASEAMRANQFISADAGTMMAVRMHDGNTGKVVIGQGWELLGA